jgi:hypothetical protein
MTTKTDKAYGVTLSITFHEPRNKTREEAERFINEYVSRLAENDEHDLPEVRWDDVEWQIVELLPNAEGNYGYDETAKGWVKLPF